MLSSHQLIRSVCVCVFVGKSVRLKQARAEVLEEMSAYKDQCDEQCMKQENEACISNQNQIKSNLFQATCPINLINYRIK